MSRFLIDENVSQKAVRRIPSEAKGFDILYPKTGDYRGSSDYAVQKIAESQGRVLVSQEKDFGQFGLKPEEVPHGAIWLRPRRISQTRVGELFPGLCRVLTDNFSQNPYDFSGKIVEVFDDHVDIRTAGDIVNTYLIPPVVSN